jgi:hypothetical protein
MLPLQNIIIKAVSAVLMIAALMFLTSANFWAYGMQEQKESRVVTPNPTEEEPDSRSAVPNSTEEKTAAGLQNLSEYLHDQHYGLDHPVSLHRLGHRHDIITLPIHHPELLTPPPKSIG